MCEALIVLDSTALHRGYLLLAKMGRIGRGFNREWHNRRAISASFAYTSCLNNGGNVIDFVVSNQLGAPIHFQINNFQALIGTALVLKVFNGKRWKFNF